MRNWIKTTVRFYKYTRETIYMFIFFFQDGDAELWACGQVSTLIRLPAQGIGERVNQEGEGG